MTPPRSSRRLSLLRAALAIALASAVSCKGVEIMDTSGTTGGTVVSGGGTGTGTGTGGGGTGGTVATAMIGTWARVVTLAASDGTIYQSRTEWTFGADGSATRRVTAWNVTDGAYDTITASARWSTAGSTLTVTWLSPATGSFSLAWGVDGDILTIGPDQFARVR